LSFHATLVTVFLCPYSVLRQLPARGSHSFTRLSFDPDAMIDERGCQCTDLTSHPCPSSTRSSVWEAQSQIRTVESSPQLTNFVSAGEKDSAWMACWPCESSDWTGAMLGDQYLMFPEASHVSR
jgi:hypothetical protein